MNNSLKLLFFSTDKDVSDVVSEQLRSKFSDITINSITSIEKLELISKKAIDFSNPFLESYDIIVFYKREINDFDEFENKIRLIKRINSKIIVLLDEVNENDFEYVLSLGVNRCIPRYKNNSMLMQEISNYREFFDLNASLNSILNRFRIIVSNTQEAVALLDIDLNIIYGNVSLANLLNVKRLRQIENKNIQEFIDDGTWEKIVNSKFKDNKLKTKHIIEITTSNGDKKQVEAIFSMYQDDNNSTVGVLQLNDMTDMIKVIEQRQKFYKGITEVFAIQAEKEDNIETAGHVRRVSDYSKLITELIRDTMTKHSDLITDSYIEDISYASMLHDVGKWLIDKEVLLKPGKLDDEEKKTMNNHPELGIELLQPLLKHKKDNSYLKIIEHIVLYHHERWDGRGYPKSLKGEEIPLSARIVALADVYDALTRDRSYRKGLSHEVAYKIIIDDPGHFDPDILDIFKKHHYKFNDLKEKMKNI